MVFKYLRNSRNLEGKVIEKYHLDNQNIGIIIEDNSGKRYSVEFQTGYVKPELSNLFGLLRDPHEGEKDNIDKLVGKGEHIGVEINVSDNPIRRAYKINYVSSKPVGNETYRDPIPKFLPSLKPSYGNLN